MAGTKDGGRKAAITNRARDPDFYRVQGAKGGSTQTENTKNKGFASMTFEQRQEAGRRGNEARIRNFRKKKEDER